MKFKISKTAQLLWLLIGLMGGGGSVTLSQPPAPADLEKIKHQSMTTFREGRQLFFDGNYEEARHKFRESYETSQKATEISGDIRDTFGLSLKYEALCFQYLGDLDRALALFQEALEIHPRVVAAYKASGHPIREDPDTDSLNNIGWLYYLKGNYKKALEFLLEAEATARRIPAALQTSPQDELWLSGRMQTGLGLTYMALGQWSRAEDYLVRVVEEGRHSNDLMNKCWALQALGKMEALWGDYPRARELIEQAVAIGAGVQEKSFNKAFLVESYMELGIVAKRVGDKEKAHEAFEQALQMSEAMGLRNFTIMAINHIGSLLREEGRNEAGLQLHQRAQEMSESPLWIPGMVRALVGQGDDYLQLRLYPQAKAKMEQALAQGKENINIEQLEEIYYGLATVSERTGDAAAAMEYFRRAIQIIKNVDVRLLPEDDKITYWQTNRQLFYDALSFYARLNERRPAKEYRDLAFDVVETARARAFLDLLVESSATLRKEDKTESASEEDILLQKIASLQDLLTWGRYKFNGTPGHPKSFTRDEESRLITELHLAERALEDFKHRVRITDPVYARIHYPSPWTLTQVKQQILNPGDLLLEFILGKERSFLLAVSKDSTRLSVLAGEGRLTRETESLQRRITAPPRGPDALTQVQREGASVFKLLLGPVDDLLVRSNRLIIIPDGKLSFLPFEALVDAKGSEELGGKELKYLVEKIQIIYAPSASVLGELKSREQQRRTRLSPGFSERRGLLAFGDPYFKPASLQNQGTADRLYPGGHARDAREFPFSEGLRPLPASRDEIQEISSLFPASMRTVYRGRRATLSSLLNEPLDDYRILHFATHGRVDNSFPGRSGIFFSPDPTENHGDFLSMHEIYGLKLNADVVVLSACDSAAGKVSIGEGVLGLARAFLYAGSQSVVAGLWAVNDESTAVFMKEFYRQLVHDQSSHSTSYADSRALQRAKLKMLRSNIPAYHHPYFWAPFVFIGMVNGS